MLILVALALGAFLCYLSLGIFSLSLWSDQGRYVIWTISAILGIPGVALLIWFVVQVITQS